MAKSFTDFMKIQVSSEGFSLHARDAYDTYNNIRYLFKKNKGGFFSSVKPMHIDDLKEQYKILCPGMENAFPGHIDKIFTNEIITKLGFFVDTSGMVHID